MPNMSYCRFGNTLEDLNDCLDVLNGNDEYFNSVADLSESEYNSMLKLVEVCREIIDLADSDHDGGFFDRDQESSDCNGFDDD